VRGEPRLERRTGDKENRRHGIFLILNTGKMPVPPFLAMVSEAKFRSVSGGKIGTSNWKTGSSGHWDARLEISHVPVP
jgi:hypothetical protein